MKTLDLKQLDRLLETYQKSFDEDILKINDILERCNYDNLSKYYRDKYSNEYPERNRKELNRLLSLGVDELKDIFKDEIKRLQLKTVEIERTINDHEINNYLYDLHDDLLQSLYEIRDKHKDNYKNKLNNIKHELGLV